MAVPVIETSRLILRPLELADAGPVQELFPHWEIVRLLAASAMPWPYPPDGAHRFYEHLLKAIERGDEWCWTLRLKARPDQLIGVIELARSLENNRGFWLGLPWQGQGLMTEACDAVTDYWFNVLGFDKLRVPKAAANAASRRISEKQGMRIVETKESDYISGRLPTEVWELTAEEWRERRRKS